MAPLGRRHPRQSLGRRRASGEIDRAAPAPRAGRRGSLTIRVILLAAGRGERLRPLTDAVPKALLEVGGEPLAVRAVAQLAARGLTNFTIVDGYRGEMIRDALLARFPASWFRFVRNEEWDSTNNAYSLHLARGSDREPVFLLDSDIAFDPGVVDRMLEASNPNRLAMRTRGGLGSEEMKVLLAPDGRVSDVGKYVEPAIAAGESVGLEVFSPATSAALFAILERRVREGPGRREYYETSFVEAIRAGEAVHAVDLGALPCMEIDTVEDLEHARAVFGGAS